jgi:hypothetical protein
MSDINTDDTAKSSSIPKVKKKIFQAVSVAVMLATSGLTLGSTPALARPYKEPVRRSNPVASVDLLMAYPLNGFMRFRQARRFPGLDWSTDLCSFPARGTGLTFDFTNACIRHDFGYRNYKKLGLFTEKKAAVDAIFYKDMKEHCNTRSVVLKPGCYAAAMRYYTAVHHFGG